jgi:ethanolamine utilization protein EutA
VKNVVTGRSELVQLAEAYRSEIVFTPTCEDRLDIRQFEILLETWLAAVQSEEIFGGGALLTGLTARKPNAAALVGLIDRHIKGALVISAEDPRLESWLAFMGSCSRLSQNHPEIRFVNLDIGGGTTNLALGRNGEVLRTGCLFVGARHVQVQPGTYRIIRLSSYATSLFDALGISKGVGDSLNPDELEQILDFYIALLQRAVAGDRGAFETPIARLHEAAPFDLSPSAEATVVTLSGGVGELVYSHLSGHRWPATTLFGDLGIDLAQRLARLSEWNNDFRDYVPLNGGRATVYGLLQHSTQVSGNTLFLPDPDVLPLRNVPILGSISVDSTREDLLALLNLVGRSSTGGCLWVRIPEDTESAVRSLGTRLCESLSAGLVPRGRPLVLAMEDNLGKVLGNFVTAWGRIPCDVVVIDEIEHRNAHFVQIGRVRDHMVPVSFHGMHQGSNSL